MRAGTQAAAGLVHMDVDRDMSRLMDRVRAVEVDVASLRGNEKVWKRWDVASDELSVSIGLLPFFSFSF